MRYMSTLEADRAYSESCINSFYSDLSDWVYYASTSRVLSGGKAEDCLDILFIPDGYSIKMINSWFELKYTSWTVTTTYLKKTLNDYTYCMQKTRFSTEVVPSFSEINMLPSLISKGNQNWFEIKSWSTLLATWVINMYLNWRDKAWNPTSRQEFWQVFFDARTWMIKKKLCRKYNDDNTTCKERNTWK